MMLNEAFKMSGLNPFAEFERLVEHNGINELYDSFLSDAENLGGILNANRTEYSFTEPDNWGGQIFYTETFSEKLDKFLKGAFFECKMLINNKLSLHLNEQEKKHELASMLSIVLYLHNQVDEVNTYGQTAVVKSWLKEVVKFVKEKYKYQVVQHRAFDLLTDEVEVLNHQDLFTFKGTITELVRLFRLLSGLDVFSEEVNEAHFMTLFRAENPSSTNIQLKLGCELGKAAFILQTIYPFFHNLNDKQLVDSNCLLTLQGKPVKYGSLQKQRSQYLNSTLTEEERKLILEKINSFKLKK